MMARIRHNSPLRCGFTLVELLVVVAVMIILIAVLTTAMQPVLAGSELREAARQLNAYLAAAVARAAETGRPAGIWIERDAGNANASFEVFFAEVPLPYSGDVAGTVGYTQLTNPPAPPTPIPDPTSVRFVGDTSSIVSLVKPGDTIRLNYQGPWYPITNVNSLQVDIDTAGRPIPPRYPIPGVPFQIRRQPRKSPVQPLQMPANTVVDLANSGIGNGPTAQAFAGTAASGPVIITFSPQGTIDRVYYNNATHRVANTVYLLVGRPGDQIGAANLGTAPNNNRWIAVNHQTGRVTTTENMGGAIVNAREFATAGQGMGGSQ